MMEAEIPVDKLSRFKKKQAAKFRKLRGIIQQRVDETLRDFLGDFREELKKTIQQARIKSDTGELLSSWKIRPRGLASYELYSTADHALYLEVGTSSHTISGNDWLKFQPDDPSGYESRVFYEDPETGEVKGDYATNGLITDPLDPLFDGAAADYVATSVQHPGNKAFKYFEDTLKLKDWDSKLREDLQDAVTGAAREAGYRPGESPL